MVLPARKFSANELVRRAAPADRWLSERSPRVEPDERRLGQRLERLDDAVAELRRLAEPLAGGAEQDLVVTNDDELEWAVE